MVESEATTEKTRTKTSHSKETDQREKDSHSPLPTHYYLFEGHISEALPEVHVSTNLVLEVDRRQSPN